VEGRRGLTKTAIVPATIIADQEMVKDDLYFLAWVTGRIMILFVRNSTGI
jgi:hypothetical protein